MEIETFAIPEEKEKIEELLNDDKYDVRKLLAYGKDNGCLLIIYRAKEEVVYNETARLGMTKDVAHSVRDDTLYSELKNANQRCLYLLDKYHIPKSVALDVIDEVIVQKLTAQKGQD